MSRIVIAIASFLLAAAAYAAPPQKVDLIYEATRNGQPFATVTESYRAENGRYRIESVTKGLGIYALFGERRLTSEGKVTAQGLKPERFELHQGDNKKKSLIADFDWKANMLTMTVKGKPTTAPLPKSAQDLSSYMYQFMFTPPAGQEVKLPVTTGKRLKTYRYTVTKHAAPLQTPAGSFKTVHLVNADVEEPDDEKELWLGAEIHNLPVKLMVRDDGAKIEQTLTSVRIE